MRLKAYLINEAVQRSKQITAKQAQQILKTKCSRAVNAHLGGSAIYRGIGMGGGDYLFVEPAKFERRSANTRNYYTLLVSNSPRWKAYPRRDQSIICTTDFHMAASFGGGDGGNTYSVFPFNGSRIGVVPQMDFWMGFENAFGIYSLDDVMDELQEVFAWVGEGAAGSWNGPSTIKDLKYALNKVTKKELLDMYEEDADFNGEESDIGNIERAFAGFVNGSFKGDSFYEFLEDAFDPMSNRFNVVKVGARLPNDREVWTDGPSVLLENGTHWSPANAETAPHHEFDLMEL